MTNEEWIRGMTDTELAEWLATHGSDCWEGKYDNCTCNCIKCALKWLKKEHVKEK